MPREKYCIIKKTITKYKLKNQLRYLCEIAQISRSGYYNFYSTKSKKIRQSQSEKDKFARDKILKAYNFKGRKKGARQIKMTLEREYGIIYNLKRIRRIMHRYDIICPIRKANPYRRMLRATKEHRTKKNLLNRQFKQNIPGKVLLTDITYLSYDNGRQRAYLSTIKDGSSNEIPAYILSKNMTLNIAIKTIDKLQNHENFNLAEGAFIHSDQGVHVRQEVA